MLVGVEAGQEQSAKVGQGEPVHVVDAVQLRDEQVYLGALLGQAPVYVPLLVQLGV